MMIVLMGYRGSGKTSVGRVLAERVGCEFVDLDDRIRSRFGGLSVAEIWREHGEGRFREVEVEETRRLMVRDGAGWGVVALGGGTLMQPGAREAVEGAGGEGEAVRVYLRCPVEELARRIAGDAGTAGQRPSLTGRGVLEEVAEVLAVRGPVYEAGADVVVEVGGRGVEEVVEEIMMKCEVRSAKCE